MSQFKTHFRSLLSVILLGTVAFGASSHADDNKDWQTEVAHRGYPLLAMAAADHLKARTAGGSVIDCGRTEVAKALFLASAFALGSEIATGAIDSGLTESSTKAHALSAFPLLAYGAYKWRNDPVGAVPYVASGMFQMGLIVRRAIAENAEAITNFAKQQGFPEEHRGHALEVAKSTVAALGISSAVLFMGRKDPRASLTASLVASSTFTLAYLLREALLSHHEISKLFGPFQVAGFLTALGTAGVTKWNGLTVQALASLALLEAGVFTAVETIISYASQAGLNAQLFQGIALTIGFIGYQSAAEARTAPERIVRQSMQAFMLPAAFYIGLDWMKNAASYWRHHAESQG